MSLAFPWALLALPLPWFVWRFVPPHRTSQPALRFPFFRTIVATMGSEASAGATVRRRAPLQMATAILVWALVVLALARPERLGEPVEITKAARDLVLAIDVSGSMDTSDFAAPDGTLTQRLAAVREVVRDFLAKRNDDRLALIVFGDRAFLQAPLTGDLRTIIDLLDQTEVGMAGARTALGDAIGLAIRTFEASEVDERLLILLSDGSDTASRMDPVNAAEIAKGEGVEIHTIGVGDPAASGEARLDIATLEDIAARTGGAYYFASDQDGLQRVYERIDALNPKVTNVLSYRPRQALAHWPLGLAGLLTVIALTVLAVRQRPAKSRAAA